MNPSDYYKLSIQDRVLLVLGCLCVIAGFLVAASVNPDPRGFGTHQQFGLPPCRFREILGIPCPSCGGTTSVAHFVRGEWILSIQANIAVFCFALSGLLSIPWFLLSLWKGYLPGICHPSKLFVSLTMSLTLIAVLQWVWRLSF